MMLLAGSSRKLQTEWTTAGIGYDTVVWEGQTAHVIVIPLQLILIVLGFLMLYSLRRSRRISLSRGSLRRERCGTSPGTPCPVIHQ
jgi:hypothetical protein